MCFLTNQRDKDVVVYLLLLENWPDQKFFLSQNNVLVCAIQVFGRSLIV